MQSHSQPYLLISAISAINQLHELLTTQSLPGKHRCPILPIGLAFEEDIKSSWAPFFWTGPLSSDFRADPESHAPRYSLRHRGSDQAHHQYLLNTASSISSVIHSSTHAPFTHLHMHHSLPYTYTIHLLTHARFTHTCTIH